MNSIVKKVWQNANGTWSHHRNRRCEWTSYEDCVTDLKFAEEWAR